MDIYSRPSFFRGPFISFQSILKNESLLAMVRRDLEVTTAIISLDMLGRFFSEIFFTMVFLLVFVILRGNPDTLLPLNIMLDD